MKKINAKWILAILLGFSANLVLAEEEQDSEPKRSGKEVAEACIACHGEKGVSPDPSAYPHLAGQHADYMVRALRDYREGRRKNQVMSAMAQNLSDADIEAVSKYFAKQDGLVTPRLRPAN